MGKIFLKLNPLEYFSFKCCMEGQKLKNTITRKESPELSNSEEWFTLG